MNGLQIFFALTIAPGIALQWLLMYGPYGFTIACMSILTGTVTWLGLFLLYVKEDNERRQQPKCSNAKFNTSFIQPKNSKYKRIADIINK